MPGTDTPSLFRENMNYAHTCGHDYFQVYGDVLGGYGVASRDDYGMVQWE